MPGPSFVGGPGFVFRGCFDGPASTGDFGEVSEWLSHDGDGAFVVEVEASEDRLVDLSTNRIISGLIGLADLRHEADRILDLRGGDLDSGCERLELLLEFNPSEGDVVEPATDLSGGDASACRKIEQVLFLSFESLELLGCLIVPKRDGETLVVDRLLNDVGEAINDAYIQVATSHLSLNPLLNLVGR